MIATQEIEKYQTSKSSCQLLTLRLGKQVWDLSCRGGDLTARLGECAAILAERQQRGE